MPKITPWKLHFCRKLLNGIKLNYKKYKIQLRSCLQDAESPSVARSISRAIVASKVQQKKSLVALKRVVKKQQFSAIKSNAQAYVQKENEEDDDDEDE
jgi:hypothetical protein